MNKVKNRCSRKNYLRMRSSSQPVHCAVSAGAGRARTYMKYTIKTLMTIRWQNSEKIKIKELYVVDECFCALCVLRNIQHEESRKSFTRLRITQCNNNKNIRTRKKNIFSCMYISVSYLSRELRGRFYLHSTQLGNSSNHRNNPILIY